MSKKVLLWDVDGTLANLSHRLHHIKGGKNDWVSFNAGIPNDSPIEQTIFLNNLIHRSGEMDMIVASGRSEDERSMTEAWLLKFGVQYQKLYMRKAADKRADYIIKLELLDQMRADGYDPFIIVDDRQVVTDAWRKAGLFVLQCDPHNAECRSDIYQFDKKIRFPLTIMVGPSGSGKSTWVNTASDFGHQEVISSDNLRQQICGDFRDQTQNERVFRAMHELAETRLKLGLPVILDATHIRRSDRLNSLKCLPSDLPVKYVVINRPLHEKEKTGGWRTTVEIKGESLIKRHDQVFKSNLKDILNGDGFANVTVQDLRT